MSLQGNNLPVYACTPQNYGGSIANPTGAGSIGTGTNATTIYTAGANGSRVYSLLLSNNTSSAYSVFLIIKNGSTYYNIGQVSIPANSGNTAGTPCVDALSPTNCPGLPFDGTGKPYVELTASALLMFSTQSALSAAGNTVYASTMGADY